MKLLAPVGATAIFCTLVIICSFHIHSISAAPNRQPPSHVLLTSTTAPPARTKKVERNPPTTATPGAETTEAPVVTTAAPVADTAAAIIANATDGIETALEERAGETEPFVHSFVVHSDIKFRYSRTQITSAIVNPHRNQSHEVRFNVTLPEKAFIFQFSMTVDGNTYDAYVDDRASAWATYLKEKEEGDNAGLVQTEDTRNAQRFTILANVKASSAVIFTLTYEELLERKYGHYEQVIHVESDEVRNSGIIVSIADTKNITMLKAVGRQKRDDTDEPMTGVGIEVDGAYGILAWAPNATSNETTTKIPERFVVQYDVEHHPGAGEILVRNGYFVHFFAPQAPVYPKHIIFVLDVSGSMSWGGKGGKILQLRQAMSRILDDLLYNHQRDYFSIITFNHDFEHWTGGGSSKGVFPVTTGNIDKARAFTDSLQAGGGTNIQDALEAALTQAQNGPVQQRADPIIMFLTDGQGYRPAEQTRAYITSLNKNLGVPIYSLAFGKDADYPALKYLSLLNNGTVRKIYEDADAALQLENFYAEISSPILNGVTFKYTSDLYNVSDVTRRKFARLFKGTELVVAGKIMPLKGSKADPSHWSYDPSHITGNQTAPTAVLGAQVSGQPGSGAGTTVFTQPAVNTNDDPISQFTFPNTTSLFRDEEDDFFMERLWAYLTVKQLLQDAQDESDFQVAAGGSAVVTYPAGEDPNVRARDLAMEYRFVTPLTSLVVVMPDDSSEVSVGQDAPVLSLQPQVQTSGPAVKNVDPLEKITWLTKDDVSIQIHNATDIYMIARDNSGANAIPIPGNRCGSQSSCMHLRDCVRPEFSKDARLYRTKYFCGLRSPTPDAISYAGVCCPVTPSG